MDEKIRCEILDFAADAKEVRIWIEHWQDDVAANLKPTETSLKNIRDKAKSLEDALVNLGLSDA